MPASKSANALESNAVEKTPSPAPSPTPVDEKALIRKMDLKILPMLFLVYVAAFLDR